MKLVTIFITFFSIFLYGEESNIDKSIIDKYNSHNLAGIKTIQELAKEISSLTENSKEQLQILLLWSNQNMYADSVRFFSKGNPLSTEESIKGRIALCDEFSNIVFEICGQLKIPCFRVEGYVKYLNFNQKDIFEEANHAWNAIYIDSSWVLCDLFWSTNVLKVDKSSTPHFVKKLNTKYFLSKPADFIQDHLPCDPTFQFDNYPIKIESFVSFSDSNNFNVERSPFFNYQDSIKKLITLNKNKRTLKMAEHGYFYNKHNPNGLIIEYYNYGVLIVNNKASSKSQLIQARSYFTKVVALTDKSNKQEIKQLKDVCKQAINNINKKLNVN